LKVVPTEKIGTCFCGQSLNLSYSSCSGESLYRSPISSLTTYPAKVSSGIFLQACTEIDSQWCRRGPANGQYAGSDLPAAEDLILVEEYTDHTTITAEASRNIGVAAKAKDLNTSLLTSDEMKKLEPMAEPPPVNFYPDGGPYIQFGDINDYVLGQSSLNGDMVDGSKQSTVIIPSFELSCSGGINPSDDVCVLNADNAPQEPYTSELGLKDSPPLMDPLVSPWSPREKQLYAMYAEEKAHLEEFKELGCYLSKHLLIVCAAEIFKWSVNLRGEERGDGKQLFRPDLTELVTRGSKAMDMPVEEYRELSRRCILERNATVHFRNIEALECDVAHCAHAIKCFPKLWTDLPDQCVVIERFKDLKNALQEELA
jgi:hypothetical protein